MPKNHGKNKAKKESKADKLDRLHREYGAIQEELNEIDRTITGLETEYQADATSRKAYQKSTYAKLSEAYDKRDALSAKLQRKQTEYNAVEAEPESSSTEGSKKSRSSGSSSEGRRSSRSSDPAVIGWDCGVCGGNNFTDPWGLDNMCACGHQFCDNDDHCTVQWNP